MNTYLKRRIDVLDAFAGSLDSACMTVLNQLLFCETVFVVFDFICVGVSFPVTLTRTALWIRSTRVFGVVDTCADGQRLGSEEAN